MPYSNFIKGKIENLNNSFKENELAYLTLTSKVENPIRDKIAFELHKKYSNNKIICREWTNNKENKTKADIAILDKISKQPECIIEFKAHSSMKSISQWSKSLVDDYQKNASFKNCNIIFILFANFIEDLPNKEFETAIKYYDNLDSAIKNHYTVTKIENQWKTSLSKKVKCNIEKYEIECGNYENTKVKIIAFFHQKIKINE